MREASTALGFGRGVQLVQRSRKSGGFLLREHTGQVLVKGRFHLGFGGFQVLGLFGGEQQLAAPVVGGVLPGEVALSFQIFCAARNGGLVRVQKLGQLCLGAAGAWIRSISAVPTPSSRTVSRTSFSASRAIFVIFRWVMSIGVSPVSSKDVSTSL